MTPQEEAEAIEIELELRKRQGNGARPDAGGKDENTDELKAQWASASPIERAGLMMKRLFSRTSGERFVANAKEVTGPLVNAAIEGGAPALGQELGVATGPFAPVAVPVLGAVGGMVGDAIVQARGDEPFSPGRMLGAGAVGAVPGAPLAGAGVKQVAKEAGKYAAANLAGSVVASEVDRGELPSLKDAALDVTAGAVGALGAWALSKEAKATADELLYAKRNALLKDLRKEGVVVPPHELEAGHGMATATAGKGPLQEEASKRNQYAWQKMAREEIGLSKEALPISVADLEQVRADYAKPYQELDVISQDAKRHIEDRLKDIAKESDVHAAMAKLEEPAMKESLSILGKLAAADVDGLKQARFKAQRAYDSFRAGNPTAYDEYINQRAIADKIEQSIEEAAASLKDSTLLGRLREARQKIAQTYSVQDALNRGNGLVDPVYLGRQLDRGEPLTGNLKKIGEFAMAFQREAVEAGRVPTPGGGGMSSTTAAQQAARGSAPGMVSAAMSATAGVPARMYLLSDFVQDGMLSPEERQNLAAAFARYMSEHHPESRKQKDQEATRR